MRLLYFENFYEVLRGVSLFHVSEFFSFFQIFRSFIFDLLPTHDDFIFDRKIIVTRAQIFFADRLCVVYMRGFSRFRRIGNVCGEF